MSRRAGDITAGSCGRVIGWNDQWVDLARTVVTAAASFGTTAPKRKDKARLRREEDEGEEDDVGKERDDGWLADGFREVGYDWDGGNGYEGIAYLCEQFAGSGLKG